MNKPWTRAMAVALAAAGLLALGACNRSLPQDHGAPPVPPPAEATAPPAPDLAGGPGEAAPAPEAGPGDAAQVVTMAPIPNPEDMAPDERARVHRRYDGAEAPAPPPLPAPKPVPAPEPAWSPAPAPSPAPHKVAPAQAPVAAPAKPPPAPAKPLGPAKAAPPAEVSGLKFPRLGPPPPTQMEVGQGRSMLEPRSGPVSPRVQLAVLLALVAGVILALVARNLVGRRRPGSGGN